MQKIKLPLTGLQWEFFLNFFNLFGFLNKEINTQDKHGKCLEIMDFSLDQTETWLNDNTVFKELERLFVLEYIHFFL